MTKQEEYFAVFDVRAPTVRNISVNANGTVLIIKAEDPGEKASGIAEVWVVYPKDKTRYPAYKEESGLYKAVVKEGANNFVVFLKDNEGNVRAVEGVLESYKKNEKVEGEGEKGGEDWGPFLIIMFIIIVVIAGILGKVVYEQMRKK
jgi:hypothetical protein